jgi:hypothetical protein
VVPGSEGGPTLQTIGGNGWGLAVYNGANGPPIEMDCQTAEIEFVYNIRKGDNSGFFFSIRTPEKGKADNVDAIKIGAYELQLGNKDLTHINTLKAREGDLAKKQKDGTLTESVRKRLEGYIADEKKRLAGSIYDRFERIAEPGEREDGAWGDAVKVVADEPGDGRGTKFEAWINGVKVADFVSEESGRGLGRIGLQAHNGENVVLFKELRWRIRNNRNE